MRFGLVIVLVAAVWAPSAWADFLIESPGTGAWRTHNNGSVGFNFTVTGTSDLTVTSLGFIDKDTDGLATSHRVGLWLGGSTSGTSPSATGPLLGSVTVASGTASPLIGGYRYVALTTPVILEAGSTYTIGAETLTNADQFISSGNTADFHAVASNPISRYSYFDGFMPRNYDAGTGLMAPNMIFSVPEPASLGLIAMGAVGLLSRRRRVAWGTTCRAA
jgi:hypothetical protein